MLKDDFETEELRIRIKKGTKDEFLALLYHGKMASKRIDTDEYIWYNWLNRIWKGNKIENIVKVLINLYEYMLLCKKIFDLIDIPIRIFGSRSYQYTDEELEDEREKVRLFFTRKDKSITALKKKIENIKDNVSNNDPLEYLVRVLSKNIIKNIPEDTDSLDHYELAIRKCQEDKTLNSLSTYYPSSLKEEMMTYDFLVGKTYVNEITNEDAKNNIINEVIKYFDNLLNAGYDNYLDEKDKNVIIAYVLVRYRYAELNDDNSYSISRNRYPESGLSIITRMIRRKKKTIYRHRNENKMF